jgi:hypothetical protein
MYVFVSIFVSLNIMAGGSKPTEISRVHARFLGVSKKK